VALRVFPGWSGLIETMTAPIFWTANLVATLIVTFCLYFPRHHRRDMVVAYLGVNIGVAVVTATLVTAGAGIGLGLGLFGVLSIIRLRATPIGHREVAYYFATLTLGVLGGLGISIGWLALLAMGLIVAVLAIADHPKLLPGYCQQTIRLNRAFTDQTALVAHLESLLGGRVHHADVKRLDLVKNRTLVEVRYSVPRPSGLELTDSPMPARRLKLTGNPATRTQPVRSKATCSKQTELVSAASGT